MITIFISHLLVFKREVSIIHVMKLHNTDMCLIFFRESLSRLIDMFSLEIWADVKYTGNYPRFWINIGRYASLHMVKSKVWPIWFNVDFTVITDKQHQTSHYAKNKLKVGYNISCVP